MNLGEQNSDKPLKKVHIISEYPLSKIWGSLDMGQDLSALSFVFMWVDEVEVGWRGGVIPQILLPHTVRSELVLLIVQFVTFFLKTRD